MQDVKPENFKICDAIEEEDEDETPWRLIEMKPTTVNKSSSVEQIIIPKNSITYSRNMQEDQTRPVTFLRRKPNPEFLTNVL